MSNNLPDYDKFIIEAIIGTLHKWIDVQRYDVVWLQKIDIDHLEKWAKNLAKSYRHRELEIETANGELISKPLQQPYEGWTPAEPWKH